MSLLNAPRTILRIDVNVEASLAEGMDPRDIEALQAPLIFLPCKNGVRIEGWCTIFRSPGRLSWSLKHEALIHYQIAQLGQGAAYHYDCAAALTYAAKLVQTRAFVRRYWPHVAEYRDESASASV